jgi:hypothetical protein
LALLVLDAVNQLSSNAASTVATHENELGEALIKLAPTTPGFALFLLAGVVVVGTMLLWFELVVRSVVLTLLLVLVPVVVPLVTFPSLRRLGWRLGETFAAVAASKFVIVITLVLGLNEITGGSTTGVVTGAVTLLLATATPYLVLRVVPFLEHSAVHQFEGLRARATRSASGAATSPLGQAVSSFAPNAPEPSPPSRPADLGLETWPGSGESPLPPLDSDAPPPPPPIGRPRLRGGHVAYRNDEGGPVVGWHFDE